MSNSTISNLFMWGSYVLIAAATAVFFLTHKNVPITLLLLLVAVYSRAVMYRYRHLASEEENETLRQDLHRLTALLREVENPSSKKKN